MTPRRGAVAVALVVLLATSGCIGFLTGSEALTFASNPVAVSEEAQQSTGYEQKRKTESTLKRTFSVAGQERTVKVTNHIAEYAKSTSIPLFGDQQVARFTVLSTPKVTIAGQGPFNPVSKFSNRELVLKLQQQYDTISNVQFVGNRTVPVLGEQATVSKFRADAKTVQGTTTEVFIHITKVADGDDFVIAVAVHPTQLDAQQEVNTLLSGIQHGESA